MVPLFGTQYVRWWPLGQTNILRSGLGPDAILCFSQNISNMSQVILLSLCYSQVLLLMLFHLQTCVYPASLTCPAPSLRPCVSKNLFPLFPHQSYSFSLVGQSLYPESLTGFLLPLSQMQDSGPVLVSAVVPTVCTKHVYLYSEINKKNVLHRFCTLFHTFWCLQAEIQF